MPGSGRGRVGAVGMELPVPLSVTRESDSNATQPALCVSWRGMGEATFGIDATGRERALRRRATSCEIVRRCFLGE